MKLEEEVIKQFLGDDFPGNVYVQEQVDSTQNVAKRLDDQRPTAVLAEMQTTGYGKEKRSFYSPQNSGLYLSVLLPQIITDELPHAGLFTTGLAVAITQVLEKFYPTKRFMVKWVNDILLNKKKVAGILVESILEGQSAKWIVGLGINLTTANFPAQLQAKAGSIAQQEVDRNRLAADIIKAVWKTKLTYQTKQFINEYQQRLILMNQEVTLQLADGTVTGVVKGIAKDGELIVQQPSGMKVISAGEVVKVNY
ncbi:biotin--[acetyl-CoA-carboxylase] ligase [Limosilactobacillus coleohominis]|nr:biotin--[acetyl-CoA-carboxylase] ligase [Limosilactobacillus coleohominis]